MVICFRRRSGGTYIDAYENKHALGVTEGATRNATPVQALLDKLIERGLATDRAYCSSWTVRRL